MSNKYISIEAVDPEKSESRYLSILESLKVKKLIALTIEVTSKCNLSCSYCGMHNDKSKHVKHRKEIGSMELDKFTEIITKCRGAHQIDVLYLHGMGEPLLHPNLVEFISIAKKAGIAGRIVVITNGIKLNWEMLNKLIGSGLDEVRISYDVFDEQCYTEIKGANLSLVVRTNIEECLHKLKEKKINVRFHIDCKKWIYGNYHLNEQSEKVILHFEKLVSDVDNASIRLANEFDWNSQAGINGTTYKRSTPCEGAFYNLLIHSDGEITPCCLDITKELSIGNIHFYENIDEVLASTRLLEIRTKLLSNNFQGIESCRQCNVTSCVDKLLQDRRNEILPLL